MGTKLFDRWLSHTTDRSKDFVKFHAAVDDKGAAHAIAITDGTTNDAIVLPYLLHDIDARLGIVCLEDRSEEMRDASDYGERSCAWDQPRAPWTPGFPATKL